MRNTNHYTGRNEVEEPGRAYAGKRAAPCDHDEGKWRWGTGTGKENSGTIVSGLGSPSASAVNLSGNLIRGVVGASNERAGLDMTKADLST